MATFETMGGIDGGVGKKTTLGQLREAAIGSDALDGLVKLRAERLAAVTKTSLPVSFRPTKAAFSSSDLTHASVLDDQVAAGTSNPLGQAKDLAPLERPQRRLLANRYSNSIGVGMSKKSGYGLARHDAAVQDRMASQPTAETSRRAQLIPQVPDHPPTHEATSGEESTETDAIVIPPVGDSIPSEPLALDSYARPGLGRAPEPPDFKAEYIEDFDQTANREALWQLFLRLPDVTFREANTYLEILTAEGILVAAKSEVPGEPGTVAGIENGVLKDMLNTGRLPGFSDDAATDTLTNGERALYYRAFMYHVFGERVPADVLALMPSNSVAASFADVLFRGGGHDGTLVLQRAINDVSPDLVEIDGVIGSRTIRAFVELASDSETRSQLSDALVERRDEVYTDPGDPDRTRHFVF